MSGRGPDQHEPEALAEVLSALGHPVRVRVIKSYDDGIKLSPSKLQDTMSDVPLGTLAYHVRQLADAGILKRAGSVTRRGAIEHLYVLTPRGTRVAGVLDELQARL